MSNADANQFAALLLAIDNAAATARRGRASRLAVVHEQVLRLPRGRERAILCDKLDDEYERCD